jgi:hypothetical protein
VENAGGFCSTVGDDDEVFKKDLEVAPAFVDGPTEPSEVGGELVQLKLAFQNLLLLRQTTDLIASTLCTSDGHGVHGDKVGHQAHPMEVQQEQVQIVIYLLAQLLRPLLDQSNLVAMEVRGARADTRQIQ